MTQAVAVEYLLRGIDTTEEEFLNELRRPFSHLPIRFYFHLRKKYSGKNMIGELIFHPERKDAFNKKPHRGFVFQHPQMGELICYLFHQTADWFSVVLAFSVPYEAPDEPKLEGPLIFSSSFWTLDGMSKEKENSTLFTFRSGTEGAVNEKNLGGYFQKLDERYSFYLELAKILKECNQ